MFESVRVESVSKQKVPAAVVIGQFKGEGLDERSAAVDEGGYAAWMAGQAEATGELGSCVTAYPDTDSYGGPERVLIVGLGERDAFNPGHLRAAAGAAGRAIAGAKAESVLVRIDDALLSLDDPPAKEACGRAFGEGLGIVSFTADSFRGKATTVTERTALSVAAADKGFEAGLKEGLGLSEGTNLARTLSNTPPNLATPMWIAAEAKKLAKSTGMSCTVIAGDDLKKERLAGIFTVGQASENEPCLVRLEYTPGGGGGPARSGRAGRRRSGAAKPVVLVGKTITYDSGGLSIKTGGGMRGMKRDKDGGCGVLGAMHAIATVIKPRVPVVALLACAENSISDEAYRPDDIITFRNGVTVEVTNTDAEGRLVMADALCYACDAESPRAIIDFATLTGGVVVALGRHYAGLWTEDEGLLEHLRGAGEETGERVWHLPMGSEYRSMMKSPIADVLNSAPVREAHGIQGAAFLSYFVEEGVPWAHVDIAGVHDLDKQTGPFDSGPTGFGARLAAEAVRRIAG